MRLLDVTVRTDTEVCQDGVKGAVLAPKGKQVVDCCPWCSVPLKFCHCHVRGECCGQ